MNLLPKLDALLPRLITFTEIAKLTELPPLKFRYLLRDQPIPVSQLRD